MISANSKSEFSTYSKPLPSRKSTTFGAMRPEILASKIPNILSALNFKLKLIIDLPGKPFLLRSLSRIKEIQLQFPFELMDQEVFVHF